MRSKLVDDTSPIAYGIIDNLALFSKSGEVFSVGNSGAGGRGGGGGGGGRAGGGPTRATGRGQPDDQDAVQGRPALDPRFEAVVRPPTQPWQVPVPTDEQLRNPLNIIPPAQRPRVVLRYANQNELFVSGLLDNAASGSIAQRPVVVDIPKEKGHVVLFGNNPMYRGETVGAYFLVFNTLLNWDNLNAGRKLDPR